MREESIERSRRELVCDAEPLRETRPVVRPLLRRRLARRGGLRPAIQIAHALADCANAFDGGVGDAGAPSGGRR